MMEKLCVIVTGMHRSGTSLHAGILNILGCEVGNVMKANKHNKKGYFENKYLMRNNQYLLEHFGLSWDSTELLPSEWHNQSIAYKNKAEQEIKMQFGKTSLFCLKDPRICRLLPMWLDVLSSTNISVKIIFCVRNPYDVFCSLGKRKKIDIGKAMMLWKLYTTEFLSNINGVSCLYSSYDRLIECPEQNIQKIIEFINHPNIKKQNDVKNELLGFLDINMRHNNANNDLEQDLNSLYLKLLNKCI